MDVRWLWLVLGSVWTVATNAADGAIDYPTVAAAFDALKDRTDVTIREQSGWTIVGEPKEQVFWSFAPPTHPAFPAVVRRAVVQHEGAVYIEMDSLCEAKRVECDRLMAEFESLNSRIRESMRTAKPAGEGASNDE